MFVLLAALGGLVLIAMIPPMGGGNEHTNFQRAATIASGHMMVRPAKLPGGIADFLAASADTFPEGRNPPYSYSRAEFQKLASIRLESDRPVVVQPNAIAVLHPLSYLPQAPAMAIGQSFGVSPLILFYLGRLAGLAAGITLIFYAIRIIPGHKHALAAIALLPTILFTRSTLDADQFTNGLAFLFVALAIREIVADGRIRAISLASLAITAFLLAQCKSAYLFLPLLALAIPTKRFGSGRAKAAGVGAIAIPGLVGSLVWMILLKQSYFQGLQYTTWSGTVLPDRQLSFILWQPLDYAGIVARTLFATPLVPKAVLEFLGIFGPPVMMPMIFYPALAILLAATILSGDSLSGAALRSRPTRTLALAIVLATTGTILTLLYLQWTRYQGPVIEGFSGRYLYPVAPLLLLFISSKSKSVLGLPPNAWLLFVGIVSLGGTWWVTWATYWA